MRAARSRACGCSEESAGPSLTSVPSAIVLGRGPFDTVRAARLPAHRALIPSPSPIPLEVRMARSAGHTPHRPDEGAPSKFTPNIVPSPAAARDKNPATRTGRRRCRTTSVPNGDVDDLPNIQVRVPRSFAARCLSREPDRGAPGASGDRVARSAKNAASP